MPRDRHPLDDVLGDAPPSETTPSLLALARRQAARRRPADLLAQWERDLYVAPSVLDARTMHALDGLGLAAADEYEALLLSPVAPLGSCSVIAPTSQDRTLYANRGTEVVSDPTNVLALECARRLRGDPRATPRLCTIHQVTRCQPLPPGKGFSRHFRLLAMVEAGPARAEDELEVEAFGRAIETFVRVCERGAALGYRVPACELLLRTAAGHEVLGQRVAARLGATGLPIQREPLESPYYDGVRVLFNVRSSERETIPLGDVGRFDWVARLTTNRRMRMVGAGFGLQLLPLRFRGDAAG